VEYIRDKLRTACTRKGVVDLGPEEGVLHARDNAYSHPIYDLKYLVENSDTPSAIRACLSQVIEILGFMQVISSPSRPYFASHSLQYPTVVAVSS
jgi:hypothetical protein